MKALFIADPYIPVPPSKYGGTERVVAHLCEGFSLAGHDVTLLAKKGSRNFGRVIPHRVPDNTSYISRASTKIGFQFVSMLAASNCDVILNFGRIDYVYSLLRFTRTPLIFVFQNPINQREIDFIESKRARNAALVGISRSQSAPIKALMLEFRTIFNGIDTKVLGDRIEPAPGSKSLAFVGRFNRNKGADAAIEVAKRLSLPIRLAAPVPVTADDKAFFEAAVKPHLGPDVDWVGEIGDEDKVAFLDSALATLMPIRWEEPFGLVAVESLACGTPVVAMRRGALPEIVDDGRTGFLCDSVDEMVRAIGKVETLDRAECRRVCERRFSKEVMVEQYLELAENMVRERQYENCTIAVRGRGPR